MLFHFKSESMTFQNVLTWSITSAHSLNGSWLGLGLTFNHGSPTLCTLTLGNWNDLEQSFKLLLSQHHLYCTLKELPSVVLLSPAKQSLVLLSR